MISPEIRQKAKAMIQAGYPRGFISEQLEISDGTVKNIKKEMRDNPETENAPDAVGVQELSEKLDIKDYNTLMTKKESEVAEKIAGEIQLFEDAEEGWTFHMTAQKLKIQKSGLWWSFIAYPESAPENWLKDLEDKCSVRGFQAAISPLHDKDKWNHDSDAQDINGKHYEKGEIYKAGDLKKKHWHGILKSGIKITYAEAAEFIRDITHGPYPVKTTSLKGSYEYFTHEGRVDKYHYEVDEIQRFNNFTVEPTESEKKIIMSEINDICCDECIENYSDLIDRFRNQVEYQTIIAVRAMHFNSLTTGIYQKTHASYYYAKAEYLFDKKMRKEAEREEKENG